MNRLIVIAEGVTEQTFVRELLAGHLAGFGVFVSARLVGKPGRKGGIGPYVRARNDVMRVLRADRAVFCTTMFDFYGMPDDWPGRQAARTAVFEQKAEMVEQTIMQDIQSQMGRHFDQARFIPYVQMHEFEALLFSEPVLLAEAVGQPELAADLQGISAAFASPEEINDNVTTSPSHRLMALLPGYRKPLLGAIAARRIGLPAMRQRCPHFDGWVSRLEQLGR